MLGGAGSLPGASIALALLLLFSYWHLRHAGLALLAVLAPLLGFAAAAFLVPGKLDAICYLVGYGTASFLAADVASAHAVATTRPVRHALQSCAAALIAAFVLLIVATILLPVLSGHSLAITVPPVSQILACGVSIAILLPAGAFLLRYGETFITRSNRAAEAQTRWLAQMAAIAQPRWGWSLTGIALVLSVLGFFGMRDAGGSPVLAPQTALFTAAWAVLVLGVAYCATRNLRRALASVLTLVPLVLLTVWIARAMHTIIPPLDFVLVAGLAMMPVFVMAARASASARQGDAPAVATVRALEACGVKILFIVAGEAAALCVLHGFAAADRIAAMALLLGGIGALILQPALTTMLYALFPKRVSLDAYRLR